MLNSEQAFQALMQQVIGGSDEAARQLFRDFEPALLRAIRGRLSNRIRSKFDSRDFAQDVWASFFAELPEKRAFKSTDELVLFLTRVAKNKVIDALRQRLKTQKYAQGREQSLDDSTRFDKDALAGVQPTPSQIMMTQEEWGEFLRRQPLVYRRIFILLRAGKTQEAIAGELGISRKTVHRVICAADPRRASHEPDPARKPANGGDEGRKPPVQ
jgi:RNA polymerase sigma factor (sigma-70 family)